MSNLKFTDSYKKEINALMDRLGSSRHPDFKKEKQAILERYPDRITDHLQEDAPDNSVSPRSSSQPNYYKVYLEIESSDPNSYPACLHNDSGGEDEEPYEDDFEDAEERKYLERLSPRNWDFGITHIGTKIVTQRGKLVSEQAFHNTVEMQAGLNHVRAWLILESRKPEVNKITFNEPGFITIEYDHSTRHQRYEIDAWTIEETSEFPYENFWLGLLGAPYEFD